MKKILWYAVIGSFSNEQTARKRLKDNPTEENSKAVDDALNDEMALTELYRREVCL